MRRAELQRDLRRSDRPRDRDRNEWLAARTLDDIRRDRDSDIRLREVDRNERERYARQSNQIRQVSRERVDLERRPHSDRPTREADRASRDADRVRGDRGGPRRFA